MTTLTNSAEGGTSGTTVTTSNSGGASGNAFDGVNLGTGATTIFDNTHAAHGTLAYELATGATSSSTYFVWSTSIGTNAQVWFRLYMYWTANPGTVARPFAAFSASTLRGAVNISTAGKIVHVGAAGTIQTGTVAIGLNQWVRLEGFIIGSATVGQIETKLFNTADSTTADETLTDAATQNTGGTIDTTRFGLGLAGSNFGPAWFDDLGLSNTGYLGPAGGQTVNLTAAQVNVAAPAPLPQLQLGVAVAQETIAAAAPLLQLRVPLLTAQETVSAPAPSPRLSLALPLAQVSVAALPVGVSAGAVRAARSVSTVAPLATSALTATDPRDGTRSVTATDTSTPGVS